MLKNPYSKYNGRQIASDDFNLSYFDMEDLNHADALPAVCNLVKNNTWMAPLFADNLSSENKKEFKKVSADISKVGQKLGATETNE